MTTSRNLLVKHKSLQNDNSGEKQLFTILAILVLLFLSGMGFYYFKFNSHPAIASTKKLFNSYPKYVDDQQCLQCHQKQAEAWEHSHHALAMQTATSEHVLANFNQTKFTRQGITTTFYLKENKYYINTEGKNYEVKYVLGVDPLQTYLITLPDGRLQNFTIAWDVKNKHWFDLLPNEKTPTGDVLHWAGRYQNANLMCITCHTTNFHKNYNSDSDSYKSTWSAINVGCQACHGPGQQHIFWSKNPNLKIKNKGLIINFDSNKKIIEACAVCHARRTEITENPNVSQSLLDNYLIPSLSADAYHADGQQLGEVYVYNSFRQSKMYQMGVTCTDCHDPHSAKLKFVGNAVCTQCHNPTGNSRFPSAVGDYDSPKHTFHAPNSTGSQCVNCHMPRKNYMIIQSRPDHSIRIPRPDLSLLNGTPNACTNCHTDKTAKWAADTLKKWYPNYDSKPLTTSNIMRATHLDTTDKIINAVQDKNPTLRLAGTELLSNFPLSQRISLVTPLLEDPVRAIRITAARVATTIPEEMLNASQYIAFKKALAELKAAEQLSVDMPGANLNLAVIYENLGETQKAINYYLHALELDPDFTPARLNLASLYNSIKENSLAKKILQQGIERLPQQGELHYSLALLLTEDSENDAAIKEFATAIKLLPGRSRVLYNYAITLLSAGKKQLAQKTLIQAHHLDPNNPDINKILA